MIPLINLWDGCIKNNPDTSHLIRQTSTHFQRVGHPQIFVSKGISDTHPRHDDGSVCPCLKSWNIMTVPFIGILFSIFYFFYLWEKYSYMSCLYISFGMTYRQWRSPKKYSRGKTIRKKFGRDIYNFWGRANLKKILEL